MWTYFSEEKPISVLHSSYQKRALSTRCSQASNDIKYGFVCTQFSCKFISYPQPPIVCNMWVCLQESAHTAHCWTLTFQSRNLSTFGCLRACFSPKITTKLVLRKQSAMELCWYRHRIICHSLFAIWLWVKLKPKMLTKLTSDVTVAIIASIISQAALIPYFLSYHIHFIFSEKPLNTSTFMIIIMIVLYGWIAQHSPNAKRYTKNCCVGPSLRLMANFSNSITLPIDYRLYFSFINQNGYYALNATYGNEAAMRNAY